MSRQFSNLKHTIAGLASFSLMSACGPGAQLDANDAELTTEMAVQASENFFGGINALNAVKTLEYRSEGTRFALDEAYQPGEVRKGSTSSEHYLIDVERDALRVDTARTLLPLVVDFPIPQSLSTIVQGKTGFISGFDSLLGFPPGVLPSDSVGAIKREARLLNPALLIRGVRSGTQGIVSTRKEANMFVMTLRDSVAPISLFIDAKTGAVAKLQTQSVDSLRRDVDVEVRYGWAENQQSRFVPQSVELSYDNRVVRTEQHTEVVVNHPIQDRAAFDFPGAGTGPVDAAAFATGERNHEWHQARASLGLRVSPEQRYVAPVDLSPGVVLLTGGSHNSLAVEQKDGIIVIEAPLNEGRSQALLAFLETRFPGKRVTHVVATHHHVDHSAGLRTFVARGIKVIVGSPGVETMQKVFRANSKLEADELSKNGKAANIIPVQGSLVLADDTNPIRIERVPNEHAVDMVIAYLPNNKLTFTSDLFNPGLPGQVSANAKSLYDFIVAKNLEVASIAGGHGFMGSLDDLKAALPAP